MALEAPGRTTRRSALRAIGVLLAARPAFAAAAAEHQVQPWPAEKPTPPLALVDVAGKPWRLADTRGQVVVLNFWATWCEPCRSEMPSLQKLQAERRAQGLSVVTVNYKEGEAAIRRFVAATSTDLPMLRDADGDATGAWTPRVFPTTVLVDRTGTARTVVIGGLDWAGAEAARLIQPLLDAPRA